MEHSKSYDPNELEVAIDPNGPNRGKNTEWRWSVCEKGKGPIRSGISVGARDNAEADARRAMNELITAAKKND